MSRLLAAATLVFALGAPAYANELDQIAAQFAENAQAGNGGKCFHACSPCDYAPGSGAHLDYDRHHKGEAGHEMQLVRIAPVPE